MSAKEPPQRHSKSTGTHIGGSVLRVFSTLRLWAAAFAVTLLFFIEYTNLWRRAHIPWDLEGYHYSLSNAIFLSLKDGRVPLWDSWTYAGIPLAGNIQAALFYPPTWLMYFSNLPFGRRLPYASLEALLVLHFAVGFVLFYLWLRRGRALSETASIAGGILFAFNGYACSQITHLGLIGNYVWFPLGFWGIDEITRLGRARQGIVKLAAASALGLLAGYPATWACYAICMAFYGLASVRTVRATASLAGAMILGLALSAVQLLPTLEATPLKQFDPKYAHHAGFKDIAYFYAMLVPNMYDFDLKTSIDVHPGKDYFYFGALGIVGFLLFLTKLPQAWRSSMPLFAALLGNSIVMFNPGEHFGRWVEKSRLLQQILSDWYFLAGFLTLLSAIAAIGIHRFLESGPSQRPRRAVTVAITGAAVAWSAWLLYVWVTRRPLASGWASAVDAAIGIVLVFGLLFCIRHTPRASVALFVLALVEYKTFGTSRRINSIDGPSRTTHSARGWAGISSPALDRMVNEQPLRVTVDEMGPFPTDWRHARVAVANGFDPFIPVAYQKLVESRGAKFTSNRLFNLPRDPELLRLLGVGFYVTAEASPLYAELIADANFTLYESKDSYYKVFALKDPRLPFSIAAGTAKIDRWTSERRRFVLESSVSTTFRLSENFYPGWQATIDGAPVAIAPCEAAFQCVDVPAGKHTLQFLYRPKSLNLGIGITLAGLLLVIGLAWNDLHFKNFRPQLSGHK